MLDDLITSLTSKARFQVPFFFMMAMNLCIMAINNLLMVFYYSAPAYHCKSKSNISVTQELKANISDIHTVFSESEVCKSLSDQKKDTENDLECTYIVQEGEWNVVNEWDLVCDWKFLATLMPTLYFLGTVIGGVVFGHIADHIGRKPIIMLCIHVLAVLGLLLYWTPYLWLYVALRIAVGVFTEPLAGMSMVVLLEFCPPSLRSKVGASFNLFWSIGAMIIGGIAYFFRSWRHTQLAVTLPFILSCIYLWLVPESLRWMLTNYKVNEAYKTTKRIARWSKVTLDKSTKAHLRNLACDLQVSQGAKENYTYLHLFKTPEMRKRCVIMLYIFFSLAVCYYGILLNLVTLSGNKYINFLIGAALEFVSYSITVLLLQKFSRKRFFSVISLLGGGSCTIGVIAARLNMHHKLAFLHTISTVFILLSKAVVSSSFGPAILLFNELFPTVVRSTGLGACIFSMRTGSLLAPQIAVIGDYTDSSVPFVIFGIMLLIGGILALLLPETKGKPMPDTVAEVERTRMKKVKRKQDNPENIKISTISTGV